MTSLQKTVTLSVGFVALVVGLFVYSVTRSPVMSEGELRDRGVFILPRPREITAFELETHAGDPFGLETLQNRWTFAFFGFTHCPDVCPTSMAVMGQAHRTLASRGGGTFQGLLVSVDPERDDGQTLGPYVTAFADEFIGVRGTVAAVAGFAEQLHAAFAKVPALDISDAAEPGGYQVEHTANIVIINPHGRYHGFIKYPQQADTIVVAFESLTANF